MTVLSKDVIRLHNVSVTPTGQTPTATRINLSARHGELVALIGPDPHLVRQYLRYMAALELPIEGDVEVLGLAPARLDRLAFKTLRARIGYLIGAASLLPIYNGLQNVMLPALYHRRKTSFHAISVAARRLLDEVGCEFDILSMPHEMTSLQQRHLQLARGLILSPDTLCLDDPFHGLTAEERKLFGEAVLRMRSRIKTGCVVMATDCLDFAGQVADRIVFVGSQFVQEFQDLATLVSATHPEIALYLDEHL